MTPKDLTPPETPAPPATPADPRVIASVLVAGTVVNGLARGKGAKLRLPLSSANVLAGLNPPRVSIDGI